MSNPIYTLILTLIIMIMKNIFELSNSEIEDCIDGVTNVDRIREILQKPNVVHNGLIIEDKFAQLFAQSIENFIGEDINTPDWDDANDSNLDWGIDIAETINEYLLEE